MNRLPMTDAMYLGTLEGRKTQTRRFKTYGKPGDVLALTCAWRVFCSGPTYAEALLRPTGGVVIWPEGVPRPAEPVFGTWRPPMFMPVGLARLHVRLTDVREERLQDITEADCIAEGIQPVPSGVRGAPYYIYPGDIRGFRTVCEAFAALWQVIHPHSPKRWEDNPFVQVHIFEKEE